MSIFEKTIETIRNAEKYSDKSQILKALLHHFSNKKLKLSPETKAEFSDFLFGEIENLTLLIPTVQSYKEKDFLFEYEDCLIGAVMACYPSADEIPESKRHSADLLISLVEKERFLENMIDEIFTKKNHDAENVKYMLSMTGLAKEEYHKGKLYQGLLHYQRDILKLPEESRRLIGEHIREEMTRYLDNPLTSDIEMNLELICDICRYFDKDIFVELLKKALWVGNIHIRFYATATMLTFSCPVSEGILRSLAEDIEYAKLTYDLLKRYRMEKRFPADLANAEYLAQSDLVRWLTYPTELGQAPDDIEYIGKIRKGEVFYVFRFRSESETLDERTRGKWLVGWSGSKGSTFSTFDLYDDYKQITVDKTLKSIKKNLL